MLEYSNPFLLHPHETAVQLYQVTFLHPLEHKASMNLLQPVWSWASQLSSCQISPVNFLFSSTVLLRVPSGLPLFLFPGGAHFRTTWGSLLLQMRRTCPSHLHLLRFTDDVVDISAFSYLNIGDSLLLVYCKN